MPMASTQTMSAALAACCNIVCHSCTSRPLRWFLLCLALAATELLSGTPPALHANLLTRRGMERRGLQRGAESLCCEASSWRSGSLSGLTSTACRIPAGCRVPQAPRQPACIVPVPVDKDSSHIMLILCYELHYLLTRQIARHLISPTLSHPPGGKPSRKMGQGQGPAKPWRATT